MPLAFPLLRRRGAKNMKLFFYIILLFSTLRTTAQKNAFLLPHQTMTERWELDAEHHRGIFTVTPYKPVFVTAGRRSDKPNVRPFSENPMYSQPVDIPYNNYEARFQFSFKTKVIYGLLGNRADLWVGYTQKAHWQLYNSNLSRPFRELNYEPEIILNFPLKLKLPGFNPRMAGLTFNHQSNGRSLPLSRSWNRLIVHAGLERKNMQLILRGWYRLEDEDDENPAILDYVGRGEAVFVYNIKRHQFSVIAASALKPSYPGRGSLQLNYSLPVINNFRMQAQFSTGYGETLIDYNHAQSTFGICVSLIEW
jgi:phospholipase A1